ncbi:MAG: tetratricopeptide repeat protein [Acidobacteria bacterium]|nr:tetratricopeptide repeat protein [Acidobacteriota bacterium]
MIEDSTSMKSDAIAFGLAGIAFGLIAGWVIGSQQARPGAGPPAAVQTAAAPAGSEGTTRAAILDQERVKALEAIAEREPSSAKPRVDLANLYFDAERYDDAIKWYSAAIKLDPGDPNVSTDLGVAYYYTNQPDKAIEQFDHSLAVDPKHVKTLLNKGIVLAFGKQDLDGATRSWEQVLAVAPDGPEGQAAKRALDSLRSAHPTTGSAPAPPQGQ